MTCSGIIHAQQKEDILNSDILATAIKHARFTHEVRHVEEKNVIDSIQSIKKRLKHDYENTYTNCRKIVRLANVVYSELDDEYHDLLLELSNILLENHNDVVWALSITMEYARLKEESEYLGDYENELTKKLLDKFDNKREGLMAIFWPTAFLFGKNNSAAYILKEIGMDYYDREEYINAHYYLTRSYQWYKPHKYDLGASTNSVIAGFYAKEAYEKMRESSAQYLSKVYFYDHSAEAQTIRRSFIPIMNKSEAKDLVAALFYREVGLDFFKSEDFSHSAYYLKQAIESYSISELNPQDSLNHRHTVFQLGLAYEAGGNMEIAKTTYKQCVDMGEFMKPTYTDVLSKIQLAQLALKQNKFFSAEKWLNMVRTDFENKNHFMDFLPDIAIPYTNEGHAVIIPVLFYRFVVSNKYAGMEDYKRAIQEREIIIELLDEYELSESILYYNTLIHLANDYIAVGYLDNAKSIAERVMNRNRKEEIISVPHMAKLYMLLADIHTKKRENELQFEYCRNAYNLISKYASSKLLTMTEKERMYFIDDVQSIFQTVVIHCYVEREQNKQFAELALNCSLFLKGLLLQSSNNLRNIIMDSDIEDLIHKYNSFLKYKGEDKVNQTYTQLVNGSASLDYAFFKKTYEAREYESRAEKAELDLLSDKRIKNKITDFSESLCIEWKDIQENLKEDDVFIEFVDFDYSFQSFYTRATDNYYIAIVLTNSGTPSIVPLFHKDQLGKQEDYYATSNLYHLIWGNLLPYLRNKKNIYFSPTGILHNISIEYLPSLKNELASLYFYRLSSGRQLLELATNQVEVNEAVLYGDLLYTLDKEEWDVKKEIAYNKKDHLDFRYIPSFEGTSFGQLKNSGEEIISIAEILKKKIPKVNLLTGKYGTEDSFKQLSGQKVDIMHLATHGYYEEDKKTDVSYTNSVKHKEDIILNRSCLILSGAMNALNEIDKPIPTQLEDGILTAKEISLLDLRHLELAVLSACQTGLGDVTNEGVFGLQRGFKKAGAKSLIVSLWPVVDEASKIMMTLFYENWINKQNMQNKYQAFLKAQNDLKQYWVETTDNDYEKEPVWDDYKKKRVYPKIKIKCDDPEIWAAFVLIDGLD